MKRSLFVAMIVLGFAGAAQAATAPSATSTASLNNFTFQLIDLNPSDGVTPWLAFNLYSTGNVSTLSDISSGEFAYDGPTVLTSNALVDTSRILSTANTSAVSHTTAGTGTYKIVGSGASASGAALGAAGGVDGANTYYSSSFITSPLSSFTVSANTAIIFSAYAATSASLANLAPGSTPQVSYASASASLETSGPGKSSFSGKSCAVDASTAAACESGMIAVSYFNYGTAAETGTVYARALVDGGFSVSAVPEADTYAMLLAGLGLIGYIVRRRKAG